MIRSIWQLSPKLMLADPWRRSRSYDWVGSLASWTRRVYGLALVALTSVSTVEKSAPAATVPMDAQEVGPAVVSRHRCTFTSSDSRLVTVISSVAGSESCVVGSMVHEPTWLSKCAKIAAGDCSVALGGLGWTGMGSGADWPQLWPESSSSSTV